MQVVPAMQIPDPSYCEYFANDPEPPAAPTGKGGIRP